MLLEIRAVTRRWFIRSRSHPFMRLPVVRLPPASSSARSLMTTQFSRRQFGALAASALLATQVSAQSQMKIPVPGTGKKLDVGDDFEDESWSYTHNNPKASYNLDKQTRLPGGMSTNER